MELQWLHTLKTHPVSIRMGLKNGILCWRCERGSVLTMHEVGLMKNFVLQVNRSWISARPNIVPQVPAQVLVHHGEHEEHVLVHVVPDRLGVISLLQGSYHQVGGVGGPGEGGWVKAGARIERTLNVCLSLSLSAGAEKKSRVSLCLFSSSFPCVAAHHGHLEAQTQRVLLSLTLLMCA